MPTANSNPNLTHYQIARNALIKTAEREAEAKVRFGPKTDLKPGINGELYAFDLWTKFFHEAMNRMAKEAKLVK